MDAVWVRTFPGRFIRLSCIRRFDLVTVPKKTKSLVRVFIRQDDIGPAFRAWSTAGMNVDHGGRVAGALAIFTERHFASSGRSYASSKRGAFARSTQHHLNSQTI